ncbi:MAG: tRNA (adenosine(37)-N6)-dimethylallyltransferase MiaA [Bdellovibrionaceae bacterium]|nr:tRNA (adenosine(37)-N6)-dimethylallyltransferase MiaA [Pseudobdellovibrionaceae bacterium]
MSVSPKALVVFVVGPTASGKSDFAVEAALRFGGEILNTDSVQVFSSVNIGTAKPTISEQRDVPHHLLGVVPEGQSCTAGDFRRMALNVVADGVERGQNLFFAVGGSGFYVQALEKGMYPVPEISEKIRQSVRRDLATRGREALYEELRDRDAEYAREISPQDTYRLQRALEINRALQAGTYSRTQVSTSGTASGSAPAKTWTDLRQQFEAESESSRPFRVLKIGLSRDRAKLRTSVENRTRRMLEQGLIEEVRELCDRGLDSWAPLASVGYKEARDYLAGRLTREALETEIVTHTMQLAKRQMTWFRRDPDVMWFDADLGWAAPLEWLDTQLKRKKDEGV